MKCIKFKADYKNSYFIPFLPVLTCMFDSDIKLKNHITGKIVNAKSLIGISLLKCEPKDNLEIIIKGKDEKLALIKIEEYLKKGD